MTRSHRRWGWFLNFGNFGDYGNSSCLHGRCCFSDYGAYVRFRAITGDLLPSAYSVSSVFQRCWGWFLNFGNFGGYGNFGNSSCLCGRCCLSDYGAYVRFRAITGDLLPSLTPLTLCFKGVGLGFSILAISAITAIAISSSFAL